ncbi:hypothetical protein SDC9_140631 [bioreactor metagenome]|uniref:Uncharacterized protein n=1 Tax=bioreactor metagenome TaxID=1076179 RepID=A0A645DY24_9ZZZZ
MRSELFLSNAETVIAYAEKVIPAQGSAGSGGSSGIDVGGNTTTGANGGATEVTPTPVSAATPTPTPTYDSTAWTYLEQLKKLVAQVKTYVGDEDCDAEAFETAVNNIQAVTAVLASQVNYSKTLNWKINYEKETNEVYVDFR